MSVFQQQLGVEELAIKMGYSYEYVRSHGANLGAHVRNKLSHFPKSKEKRKINGIIFNVYVYPEKNEEVRETIREYFRLLESQDPNDYELLDLSTVCQPTVEQQYKDKMDEEPANARL